MSIRIIAKCLVVYLFVLMGIGCEKQAKWSTEILEVLDVDYHTASIYVDYDLNLRKNVVDCELVIGQNQPLSLTNDRFMKVQLNDGEPILFEVNELFANTTYYAQSSVNASKGRFFSEVVSFKTDPLPELGCDIPLNHVKYGSDLIEIGELVVEVDDKGNWLFKPADESINLTFDFSERPNTYLYETIYPFVPEDWNNVGVSGQMPSPYLCEFLGQSEQKVRVNLLEDGNYSVQACELELQLITDGGWCEGPTTLGFNLIAKN